MMSVPTTSYLLEVAGIRNEVVSSKSKVVIEEEEEEEEEQLQTDITRYLMWLLNVCLKCNLRYKHRTQIDDNHHATSGDWNMMDDNHDDVEQISRQIVRYVIFYFNCLYFVFNRLFLYFFSGILRTNT